MSKSILERVEKVNINVTSLAHNNNRTTATVSTATSALLISKPTNQISRQVDYHIILGPTNDIPHLKMYVHDRYLKYTTVIMHAV